MSFLTSVDLGFQERKNMPFLGVPIPDSDSDPDSLFDPSTGLDVSEVDYAPRVPFRGIKVKGGASGQTGVTIKVAYPNGSYEIETVTVAAN